MAQNKIDYVIDIKNKWSFIKDVNQLDDLILNISLINNGIPYDLTGQTVIVNYVNANNTIANIGGDKVTVSENRVEVICPTDCTRSCGKASFNLVIKDSQGQVSTFIMDIQVNQGLIQNQEQSKNASIIAEDLNNASLEATQKATELANVIATADTTTYATKGEINGVKSSLEKKANQNDLEKTNKNVSPIVPIKKGNGMAIAVMNNDEQLSTLKEGLDASIKAGTNTLIISITVNYNFTNSTPQFCSNERLQVFKDLCLYALSKGIKVIVKMHTIPTSNDYQQEPADIDLWFDNYKQLTTEIITFCRENSIEEIAIHNELDKLTKEKFNTKWNNIINYCKTEYPNCKIGMSLTYQQALDFTSYDDYDWFGFNFYPSLTTLGINEDKVNLLKGFYFDLKGREHIKLLNKLKRKYNKPIYITETGCCWREGSLESPGTPNYTGAISEETQSIYLESMFTMFYNTDCIDAIYVFCANTFGEYSVWGKQGRFIVNKWYGGVLNEV